MDLQRTGLAGAPWRPNQPTVGGQAVIIASSSYPFLEVFWTMLIFFAFVIWIWILIGVFADLFRRHDTSGFAKVLWIIFIVVLPYLGVFVYLIAEHRGM